MKTIGHEVIASAIQTRLDEEAAREAAACESGGAAIDRIAARRGPALPDRQQELARMIGMLAPVPCPVCGGRGYSEKEEHADVPAYQFVERNHAVPRFSGQVQLPNAVHVVRPPKEQTRTLCALCHGASRGGLSMLTMEILRALSAALQSDSAEAAAAAAEIEEFNVRARARLAERAKAHELARQRHEEADAIEREAAERVAALRAGKSAVDEGGK